MTSAISAKGTVIVWDYLPLLEGVNITGVSQSVDALDVTSHDASDSFREYTVGLKDGGEVSLEANFITSDTNGQIAMHTDFQAGSSKPVFILLPMAQGIAMSFTAVATKFEPSFPVDGKMGLSAAFKVTGMPTLLTSQTNGMGGLAGIEETGSAALSISPTPAVGTYVYTCTVNTASTWVKLTCTAAAHTIYVNAVSQTSGVQGDAITLGDAGTDTLIWILVYSATTKSPRLYKLTVTRPAA
jgi:predicted secreted protein